ncbi:hypothetical protein [Halioxenophilus aromaticivorans]|uniref:Sulfotransferase family 2 domain-containing protein n=1 Tax=Halioxenophilus aromaticivorans TaxID=1306992 RepID=A0AAV3TZV0_9ALTE
MRTVIIHYHLFKNAGTSVDRILADSFGDKWLNFDKPDENAKILPGEISEFIGANPQLVALSSHHVVPPIPVIPGVRVIPLLFIRHPILRARSAYLFEWQKAKGLEQPQGSFAEYVKQKVECNKYGVISNFHVSKLSCIQYSARDFAAKSLRDYEVLNRAKLLVDSLPFFGLVENFYQSLVRMHYLLKLDFPYLRVKTHEANVTQPTVFDVDEKISAIKDELGEEVFGVLMQANQMDLELYKYASNRFYTVAR